MSNTAVRAAAEGWPAINVPNDLETVAAYNGFSRRNVLRGLAAAAGLVAVDHAAAVPAVTVNVDSGEHPLSIDERLTRLPAEVADRLRARFHAMIDEAMASDASDARLAAMNEARWHVAEARRLLEQATGRHWDCDTKMIDMADGFGWAMLIERERPTGVWKLSPIGDGSRELHFCTYPPMKDLLREGAS
jgi:hypothetical protein